MKNKPKKTETVPKPKAKKKAAKSPITIAVDEVMRTVLTGNYPATPERIAISHALFTLRSLDIHKTEEVEKTMWLTYKECREKILRTVIYTVLKNNMRLIDVQIVLEMLKNEAAMISAWEYEHIDEADEIITPAMNKEMMESNAKMIELFKSLGNPPIMEEDDGS